MAAKKKTLPRWPKELLTWNLTIPVNASVANGDGKIARSHLVFQFEAYGPHEAFQTLNTLLHRLLDEAQNNSRVRFVPFKPPQKKTRKRSA